MADTSSGIPLMYIQQYSTGGTGFSYVGFKFLHTYFAILFCQNKVKKNCKFTKRVFFKNAYITHEERLGKVYTYMRIYMCRQFYFIVTWTKSLPQFILFRIVWNLDLTP